MSLKSPEDTAAQREKLLEQLPEPFTKSRQFTGHGGRKSDVREMKDQFSGFGSIDWQATYSHEEAKGRSYAEAGGYKWQQELLPDIIQHTWDSNNPKFHDGGTDWLAIGEPGSGKSNTALWLAARLMEANDEAIIWRGSPSRSEWLPFHRYARICLPEGLDVTAKFVPKKPSDETVRVPLEDVVREVVRYENPVQLNEGLIEPGMFHVVYPDPEMRGVQAVYENAEEKQYDEVEFTAEDPLSHWWFGWILARVEEGPYNWMSVILDEIGDVAPEAARADEFAHYQKIEMFRDALVDARKTGLSIFMFGHSEKDIHSMIRRKIRWRISMAPGANPTSKGDVVGFSDVPMDRNITSGRQVGQFLPWNESAFQYPLPNIPYFPSPIDHSLKVEYGGDAT